MDSGGAGRRLLSIDATTICCFEYKRLKRKKLGDTQPAIGHDTSLKAVFKRSIFSLQSLSVNAIL